MLTWESFNEEVDPSWRIPVLQTYGNKEFGFFARACASTHFEDHKDREVDMEAVRSTRPDVAACIEQSMQIYNKILAHPKAKLLVN